MKSAMREDESVAGKGIAVSMCLLQIVLQTEAHGYHKAKSDGDMKLLYK